jgi:hypothetical protein
MRQAGIVVVDDFLDDPDAVRQLALRQRFVKMHSAGLRTEATHGAQSTSPINAADRRRQCRRTRFR